MQLRYQKYLKNMAIKPAGAFLTLKDALKIAQIILKVKFLQSKCYRFTVNSISQSKTLLVIFALNHCII